MADRMFVTSLILSRITLQKVPSKNGCRFRENMLARYGLLDRCRERRMRNLLRPDTPKRHLAEWTDPLYPSLHEDRLRSTRRRPHSLRSTCERLQLLPLGSLGWPLR